MNKRTALAAAVMAVLLVPLLLTMSWTLLVVPAYAGSVPNPTTKV